LTQNVWQIVQASGVTR